MQKHGMQGCSSQWLPETTDLPRILSLRWGCRRTSYRSDAMTEGRPRDTKMPGAAYSGRGPANGRVKKPDLVAPGSGIISCNAWYRKNHFCSVNHPYTAKNGTSMAVPAVSAAAALLWEKEPHLTNEQVRERLLYHAQDLGENWGMQGWGMLHVGRALKG